MKIKSNLHAHSLSIVRWESKVLAFRSKGCCGSKYKYSMIFGIKFGSERINFRFEGETDKLDNVESVNRQHSGCLWINIDINWVITVGSEGIAP